MSLHQLVYFSRNNVAGDDRAHLANLRDIIAVSQRNNQRDGITGYLIFDKTWFLQILEGEQNDIFATYRRIGADQRHGGVTLVQSRPVPARQFPNWTMAGSLRSPEKEAIFLRHGIGGAIDPSRMKGPAIIALALDLQDFEITHKAQYRQAS